MRIAVIIPTCNRPELAREAIDSALRQTLPPAQVVVVDDGSHEKNHARLKANLSPDARLLWQSNAGPAAARNRGLLIVEPETEAVLFLDDDDRLLPDALERLAQALQNAPEVPLAFGRLSYIATDGTALPHTYGWNDYPDEPYLTLMSRNWIGTPGCALVRSAALAHLKEKTVWDTDLPPVEDWDLWLRLAEEGQKFARVAEPERPVLEYRISANSLSRNTLRLRQQEIALCAKHRDRSPEGSTIRDEWENQRFLRSIALREAQKKGIALEEALLSPKHRFLRRMLEVTGIAGLYRQVPLPVRLKIRTLFGVNRQA